MNPDDIFELKRTYRLPDALARILYALVTEKYVTADDIENKLDLAADAKVAIHRLRRKLAPLGVEIDSMRNTGYWLDDAAKATILRVINPQQAVALAA